jgi:hypothetical protein
MPEAKKTAERKPPADIEVFFDVRDQSYWLEVSGRFVSLKKSDLKMHLIALGMEEKHWHDADQGRLDEFTWILWNAHRTRKIDFAGALAGHRKGIFTDGSGRCYLVTDEAMGVFD